LPGIEIFHRTFLFSLHSIGGSASGATPVAFGPRQVGQYFSKLEEDSAPHAKVEITQKYPITIAVLLILGSPLLNVKPVSHTNLILVGEGIAHLRSA
jgi:hypothetical protein